ncbi:MAG: metallophosphoesterase [Clostridia bacterium]|nr:metallophosphoesterase [Clostridia bacterium]
MRSEYEPIRLSATHRLCLPWLKRTYRILHVTDVHVSTAYPDEPEFFRKEAELRGGVYFPPEGGYSAATRFPLFFRKARELDADCVLLTGDIIDFASRSNLDILSETLADAPVRPVYCLGNHDWSSMYDYHAPGQRALIAERFTGIVNRNAGTTAAGTPALPPSPHYRLEDLGEFLIFAFDNTEDRVAPEVTEAAEDVLTGTKPVLLACHIPFISPTLVEPTFDYWKHVLLIGEGGIAPDAATRYFMELMYAPSSPVFAVAAGHIHFDHEDKLSDNIIQFTTAEGHRGDCGLIELSPGTPYNQVSSGKEQK